MNQIERDYLMQQANDLVTDFLQGQSAEIVQVLIERIEELERDWPDETEVESLSVVLHDIYQKEAHRQNRAHCPDDYNELSEQTKEYDRVLARYILRREARHSGRDRQVYEKSHKILIKDYEAKLQRYRDLAETGQAMPFPCAEVDDDGKSSVDGQEFGDQDKADQAAYERYVNWGKSVRDKSRELLKEE